MRISAHLCERIIRKLSSILPNGIGLMDTEGTILAHSDQNQIGSHCEAAAGLLSSGKDSLLIPESAQAPGQLPGLYLPLLVNQERVAALLVHYGTQEWEDFWQIASLVQEYCQRVLADSISTDYLNLKNFQKNAFLMEWLNGKYKDNEDAFLKKAVEYKLGPSRGITVAILHIYHIAFDHLLFLNIGELLDQLGIVCVANELDYLLLFNTTSREEIQRQLDQVVKLVQTDAPQYLLAVGSAYPSCGMIQASRGDADRVLELYTGTARGIIYYEDVVLESYLASAPHRTRRLFLQTLFGDCSVQEIADICGFIQTYVGCDGSISAIAEKLFAHKNTIQYRIERIRKKTGLDLRRPADAYRLQVAAFWQGNSSVEEPPVSP